MYLTSSKSSSLSSEKEISDNLGQTRRSKGSFSGSGFFPK